MTISASVQLAAPDEDVIEALDGLSTALISDILDGMSHRQQAMDHRIVPLRNDMQVAGRAFTMIASTVYEKRPDHYEKLFDSYNHMRPNDVIVITTGGSLGSGIWGELLSLGAVARGAKGVVIDGLTRDPVEIARDRFPCFARGVSPIDSDGRLDVTDFGTVISCGGVLVRRGDYVVGDEMGVVVIPQSLGREVADLAGAKGRGERQVRADLLAGVSVRDVFNRYGIL
jgi:regulator of RNase E activity RraA